MKVAILESIVMPAGHEVEFDRILVDELNNQGHEPVMLVPENFPFKIKYNAKVDYLEGGEVVTYAGANRFQKLWLSVKRESRRRKWFNSAYKKAAANHYDAIIIPTATYRYLRAIMSTDLKNSKIPVYIIFHGINPHEKANFVKQAKRCEQYKNIHLKIITLRNDFKNDGLTNVDLIAPPVFKPQDLPVDKELTYNEPLTLGFFGQYRREKNVRFFLDAFKQAHFKVPVKLIMQGATARTEDSEEFEKIIKEYENVPGIEFWHKNLIGEEWQKALLGVDVIIAPYADSMDLPSYRPFVFSTREFSPLFPVNTEPPPSLAFPKNPFLYSSFSSTSITVSLPESAPIPIIFSSLLSCLETLIRSTIFAGRFFRAIEGSSKK